jgi:hypothetical protein
MYRPASVPGAGLKGIKREEIMRRWCFCILLAVFLAFLSFNSHAIGIGDTLFVCSRQLPVHQGPSAFSPCVSTLQFGAPVKVTSLAAPVASEDGKRSRRKSAQQPVWAKISAGSFEGYVPVRCLVTQNVLNRQDPNQAIAKAQSKASDNAGKGFSETESGDLNTLKGLNSGAKSSGPADRAAMDNILSAPVEYNPAQAYQSFRKEGSLAEFSGK